ncbi:MAG: putative 2OG-Fe(II) oxygenase [Hyphomonas sp.]
MSDRTRKAYAAYQQGEYIVAREILAGASDANDLHLRGLAEQKCGDLNAAVASLSAAIAIMPGNHEIHNNLGLTYRKLGQYQAAVGSFERALKLSPAFVSAQVSLARTCLDLGQWERAYAGYAALTQVRPGDVGDAFGFASAGLEIGEIEQAGAILNALIQRQDRADYRFMRGRVNLELQNLTQALEDFETAHKVLKTKVTFNGLANLVWMMGDDVGFEDLLNQSRETLPYDVAESWLLAGYAAKAQDVMSDKRLDGARGYVLKARIHEALGDFEAQIESAKQALELSPNDEMATTQLVIGLFSCGRNTEAGRHIHHMLAEAPESQHWLAYAYTAWRLGDPTHDALFRDSASFVRQYELTIPDGDWSADGFYQALSSELIMLRRFQREPLNQSFKGGAQSARDLSRIKTGAIGAYVSSLDAPIQRYLREIGAFENSPAMRLDESEGYEFSGMWSIEMKPGGRHVNHIHPAGWISSAFYVAVPESVGVSTDKQGWFHFGQPPHSSHPALEPAGWVEPIPGKLVLFPSWMWHGTTSFCSDERRLTVPFDLIPGRS